MIFKDIRNGRFYNEDCFDAMKEIPDGVIDMVLADLPYGTTQCKWDSIIPFKELWAEYWRVCKPDACIALCCQEPFTSNLIMSQIDNFKYRWTWDKVNAIRNHLNAKKQPMRVIEDIAIFYKKQPTYSPQMREGGYKSRKTKPGQSDGFGKVTGIDVGKEVTELYPLDIIGIEGHDPNNVFHPTQKPVALFEYLIKTYTNENQIVLDNTAGSGTNAIAAINTNRKWVCIEKDKDYYYKAIERIEQHGWKQNHPQASTTNKRM